jgi:hypothetical protein
MLRTAGLLLACHAGLTSALGIPDLKKGAIARAQCSFIDMAAGTLDPDSLFGAGSDPAYCCEECEDDADYLCCPSMTHDDVATTYKYPNDDFHGASKCPACRATHTCHNAIKLNNIQTAGDRLDMLIRPKSTYDPAWPDHGSEHQQLDWKGYMYTGMKSGRDVSGELAQINICANKYLDTQICFQTEDADPVLMQTAPIMILDINHMNRTFKNGPSAVQFDCTGGTFYLFGDHPTTDASIPGHPFLSGNVGAPIATDAGWTKNGQDRHTYQCPDNEPVTIWSNSADQVSGNDYPYGIPITDGMLAQQETEMLVVNYVNVEGCADITFATLPPRYHQRSWDHPDGDVPHHDGFDFNKAADPACDIANAANCGHPLNGTKKLSEFEGVWGNVCKGGRPGRNFLITLRGEQFAR